MFPDPKLRPPGSETQLIISDAPGLAIRNISETNRPASSKLSRYMITPAANTWSKPLSAKSDKSKPFPTRKRLDGNTFCASEIASGTGSMPAKSVHPVSSSIVLEKAPTPQPTSKTLSWGPMGGSI